MNTTTNTRTTRTIRVLSCNGERFAAALFEAGFEAKFLGAGTARTTWYGHCSDPDHCPQHPAHDNPQNWGSIETTASGNQAHAVWSKLPKWQLYFEMGEDHRHSSEVGPVPHQAKEWLVNHWEILPRNGEFISGFIQFDSDGIVRNYEVSQLILNTGTDHEVVSSTNHPPEVVTL